MVDGLVDAVVALGDDARNDDHDDRDIGAGGRNATTLRGYASKALELLLDLMSYPQTRTHVAAYLSSRQAVVMLASSELYSGRRDGGGASSSFAALFRQQVDMLIDSERAEAATTAMTTTSVPEGTAASLGDKFAAATATAPHVDDLPSRRAHQRAHVLQKLLHRRHAAEASEVVFAGVGCVCDHGWLRGKVDLWG